MNNRSIDKNNLTSEEYEFLCNLNKHTATLVNDIDKKRNKFFGAIYIASPSGLMFFHPGFQDKGFCESGYDPRFRPWYNVGSTGMQNLILVFLIKENKNIKKTIGLGIYFKNILKANDWAMVIDLNNC